MATIDVKDAAGSTVAIEKPLAPGRGAASASRPVVLATEDKAAVDALATHAKQDAHATLFGAVTETAPATDTASSGLNGRLQRIAQRLTSIIALLPAALGAGGGLKIDGSGTALPVAEADGANVTFGAKTDDKSAATDTTSVSAMSVWKQISASLQTLVANIAVLGQTTQSESVPVTLASDDDVQGKLGALTETAPATDTASSGLNGRLQRVAQRITSLIALVPAALTGSGNFKVAVLEALPAGTNAIGKVDHSSTGIGHGVQTVTTAGTDVALASSTPAKWVIVQAQTDNTNLIAVGATGVDATVATGNGIILEAGESITLPIDNLADVFIDSLVNGEGVRYVYGT